MEIVSLLGIVLGLVVLVLLAYKGHSIIWVAPVCAVIVAVMGGLNILDAYLGDYIKGAADYIVSWFPAFFLGAVYGKLMDMTGIDVAYFVRRDRFAESGDPNDAPSQLIIDKYNAGEYGRKTGKGWYEYPAK